MKKALVNLSIALVVVAAAYASAVMFVGASLLRQLDAYEAALVNSGTMQVHRFEYQDGWRSGQLRYDLEWSPAPGTLWSPIIDALSDVSPDLFRISGIVDFTKGPWVGGERPLGLARMDLHYDLPESLRNSLPQYPASTPALSISSVLGFDGLVRSTLHGVDYAGTAIIDGTTADTVFRGLRGELESNSDLSMVNGELGLEALGVTVDGNELSLEQLNGALQLRQPGTGLHIEFGLGRIDANAPDTSTRFSITGLALQSDSSRVDPGIWLGDSEMNLEGVALQLPTGNFGIRGLRGTTHSALDERRLMDATAQLVIASIQVMDTELNTTTLDSSIRNISPQAYADYMQLGLVTGATAPEELPDVLAGVVNALLAERPSLGIDRLSLSIADLNDVTADLTLTYDGPVPIDTEQPEQILNGVTLLGNIRVTADAARRMIRLGTASSDPGLQGAALDSAVEEAYQQIVTMANDTGFFVVDAAAISAALVIRDGTVAVNGEKLMETGELVSLLESGVSSSPGVSPPAEPPVFPSTARFENVSLQTGFQPDPYTVIVRASGDAPAYSILGADCYGNVTSVQPDVILDYQAGADYRLSIHAESENDTTLMVLGPAGWMCDDDSYGDFNPVVTVDDPVSGSYLIWVGTFEPGAAEAELGISEY